MRGVRAVSLSWDNCFSAAPSMWASKKVTANVEREGILDSQSDT